MQDRAEIARANALPKLRHLGMEATIITKSQVTPAFCVA